MCSYFSKGNEFNSYVYAAPPFVGIQTEFTAHVNATGDLIRIIT